MYVDEALRKYFDDLAGKSSTPGGGSAAALTAALGVSLLSMVLNFTVGKDEFKKHESNLNEMVSRIKELKRKLLVLVDEDVIAYKKVSSTFKSQDGTIKEKALKDATSVPIEVCNSTHTALSLCERMLKITNPRLLSDLGVAAEFLAAAYNSAYYNVYINFSGIKDEDFIRHIKQALTPQLQEAQKLKKVVVDYVREKLT